MKFPLRAETVIPHRAGMCCIDSLLSITPQQVTACVTLHPQHLLLTASGMLDRSGFIELAAQAACGLKGASAKGRQDAAIALLGGVNNFNVCEDAWVNQTLMIYVTISGEVAKLSLLDFRIECESRLLASGELRVFYQAET
ncbi:hypothetical protein [Erwinia sorbitola]|uniref:Uncharacterized protein n=1 Tax=Erwinia sorbitola TaxID=2681984 RepID=A0A6I6F3Q3_9GAMM|nr:hypothetical protein [Erwinia sorbitola]MTD26914.1 hypothetical protein [Erwinia sorbitola]QGU88480.1 hypothetical protein GN242_15195 [Erwinia sorbitola]